MNRLETIKLGEMVSIARKLDPFVNFEEEELENLILEYRPAVYIIDKMGNLFEYPLLLHEHHYIGYLKHLAYLNSIEPEKHKKFAYLLDIDLKCAQKVGTSITSKLGRYFNQLENVSIQTWINPYTMKEYFMNTSLLLENQNQCNIFYKLLESKNMADAEILEKGNLGYLREKQVSMQKTK